jgi:glutamine amidotransferase
MVPNAENLRSYSSASRSNPRKVTPFGIVLIDYGMGNLHSVGKALEISGAKVKISSKPEDILKADKLVLPGVGAFKEAMRELKKRKLIKPIIQHIKKGRVFLGLCLGLQLLFEESEEGGKAKGLGILKGRVKKFSAKLKIPHMGWNQIKKKKQAGPLFKNIPDNNYMYFIHSYYAAPKDKSVIAAATNYAIDFTSVIWKDNIYAFQGHPEKSQKLGLQILGNFARL